MDERLVPAVLGHRTSHNLLKLAIIYDRIQAMTAVEESSAVVGAAEFRQAMGHFATGVTVVTSIGDDGEPVGTTASAVTSLSLDPPLVLVCFDRTSLTLRAVRSHGAFVVNVLAAPQQQLSANFARRGLAAAWDGVRHRPGPTGSPRLHGVLAALECTVENRLPGGDHEIVVGRVRDVEIADDSAAPLLYWRGSYLSPGTLPRGAESLKRPDNPNRTSLRSSSTWDPAEDSMDAAPRYGTVIRGLTCWFRLGRSWT
jgi:3-hydroxy-9,10-secoandrosta-1,3,5(10)-triene-9,17-dione monooxygenase reductase component